jgi:tRNA G18 (ribose-2'-O)-methylase SpoU
MNVHDHLKELSVPQIKEYYYTKTIPAASAMMHVTGDFNLSTLIRNSNFFGYEKVFYVGGKKQYDRRGAVGTYNYINIEFVKTEEEFVSLVRKHGYSIISIENNISYPSQSFYKFINERSISELGKPIFIFGEEKKGLSNYILDNSDHILNIEGRGTVRSLNVGTASGIVLSYYSHCYETE